MPDKFKSQVNSNIFGNSNKRSSSRYVQTLSMVCPNTFYTICKKLPDICKNFQVHSIDMIA